MQMAVIALFVAFGVGAYALAANTGLITFDNQLLIGILGGALLLIIGFLFLLFVYVWSIKVALTKTHGGQYIVWDKSSADELVDDGSSNGTTGSTGATALNDEQVNTSVTLQDAFSIWWSFSWRAILVSIAIGILFGIVEVAGSFVGLELGDKQSTTGVLFILLTWPLTIAANVWALREALCLTYSGYSLKFINFSDRSPAQLLGFEK